MAMRRDTLFLPEEIVTNIFKQLRVKSLIRFLSVCKFWKNLIRTPHFVADYLHHSKPCLLLKSWHAQKVLQLRVIDCDIDVIEVYNPPLIDSSSYYEIIYSNGLFCVLMDSSPSCRNSLALWNPGTREVRQIPRTSEILECDCIGFGFSAIVNDYKIVEIYHAVNGLIIGVELYSLRTGSWKPIEFACLKDVSIFTDGFNDGFNANGYIFWDAIKGGEEGFRWIVSFDLAMEFFSLIPYPDLSANCSSKFSVYEEKLCLLSLTKIGDFSQIDLWVLEEVIGSSIERWSWTKKYTSNTCPSQLDFPGTVLRNEIFLRFGEDGLYRINILTDDCKIFAIPIHFPMHFFDKIFSYVENLVSISKIDFEEP